MINDILSLRGDLMIHASFRALREFGGYQSPSGFCESLITSAGSDQAVTMPAFTYSFVSRIRPTIPFDREFSPSVTGAVSETFRKMRGAFRTSSPSHSFSVGGASHGIEPENNPLSPLGKGSVPDILFGKGNLRVVLIGCGFESLTLLHYFENLQALPYITTNCWSYMGVESMTLSTDGMYPAVELPGCAKGFRKFEDHLIELDRLRSLSDNFKFYLIDPYQLFDDFRAFVTDDPYAMLCENGCPSCSLRLERESQKKFKRRN